MKFNDEHVPESPATLYVAPESADAKKVTLVGLRDRGLEVSRFCVSGTSDVFFTDLRVSSLRKFPCFQSITVAQMYRVADRNCITMQKLYYYAKYTVNGISTTSRSGDTCSTLTFAE